MPKTRPPYPEQFRREAVELVRSGRSIRDVAESLGVSQQTLRNWAKQVAVDRRERDDGLTSAEREELRDLRRRVKRLEQERDILKRATALFARETPSAVEVAVADGQGFADPQAGAPAQHDQRSCAQPVRAVARAAHDRDNL